MKSYLYLVAALLWIPPVYGQVFTSPGTYSLDLDTSLKLEKTEKAFIVATIKGVAKTSDGKHSFTPSTGKETQCSLLAPFAFYWDSTSRILWWAAPNEVGFLDYHVSNSTKSSTLPLESGMKKFPIPDELRKEIRKRKIDTNTAEQVSGGNGG